ncbi:uncharacterized protein LOC129731793 [Wyeomyia smithii]|uniref:uncharacterized protein LOC129731793 n=1 Tax=Wyeomyia smithii TaxID=174621 RepID=UPI0024680B66|nr:uncharacterized protein LOC129731793 [Wyeomyia smithii]
MVANFDIIDPVQNEMLVTLTADLKGILADYDDIVLHKEFYRCTFVHILSVLRSKLITLLKQYSTLPKEDFEDKEIKCCGILFKKRQCFLNHYAKIHNQKTLQSATLCELKMALTKITFFERSIRQYLAGGRISSCEMLFNLKKVLKKSTRH